AGDQPDSASPAFTDAAEHIDPYVLRGSASASVEKISLMHGDAFLVADARGDLPESEQETGLYWRGTRFLRTCDVFMTGQPLIPLSHSISDEEGTCQIDLTKPVLRVGGEKVYQGTIHARRLLELRDSILTQRLILTSFHPTAVTLKLGVKVATDFRDLFEVRGLTRERRGTLHPPQLAKDRVILTY